MPIPYIIFVVRTMSVEPNISCGAILLHMEICDGHVEQNCFTSQATLLYVTKLPVVWSNFVMWSNDKLLHIPNVAPCDKFTMYAVLSRFALFWHNIHFVAIYALLCEANKKTKILVHGAIMANINTWMVLGTSNQCTLSSSSLRDPNFENREARNL